MRISDYLGKRIIFYCKSKRVAKKFIKQAEKEGLTVCYLSSYFKNGICFYMDEAFVTKQIEFSDREAVNAEDGYEIIDYNKTRGRLTY